VYDMAGEGDEHKPGSDGKQDCTERLVGGDGTEVTSCWISSLDKGRHLDHRNTERVMVEQYILEKRSMNSTMACSYT